MKSDFDKSNKENKEYGSSSLDYYNDEISRKAVGKLFEDIEDELAVSSEDEKEESGYELDKEKGKPESRPINNYFYEENRVKDEPAAEGIVRGFEREPTEEKRPRRTEPRMTAPISDATEPRRPVSRRQERESVDVMPRTDREEREQYRKQFLGDMENNRRPAREPNAERAEKPVRPVPQERQERRVPPAEQTDRPRKRPGTLEEYRSETRKPLRPKRPEQELEELNNAEKRYSRRAQETEPKIQKAKQTGAPGKRASSSLNYHETDAKADFLSQPIFKAMAGVGILFLFIMIFMGLRINSLSRELREFSTAGAAADQATIDALNDTIEDHLNRISVLTEENNKLMLMLQNLTVGNDLTLDVNGEENSVSVSGGGTAYTVVSGDSLSVISERFYGNSTTGVQRIREANGLTSDNLVVGQELIIPE